MPKYVSVTHIATLYFFYEQDRVLRRPITNSARILASELN